jgi:hypothetical protein
MPSQESWFLSSPMMMRTYTEPQQGNEPHAEGCASKIPLTEAQHCNASTWVEC